MNARLSFSDIVVHAAAVRGCHGDPARRPGERVRMLLHPSLRFIEASDAAQRLAEAAPGLRPARTGLASSSSRRRAARRTISRARSRSRAAARSACIASASPSSRRGWRRRSWRRAASPRSRSSAAKPSRRARRSRRRRTRGWPTSAPSRDTPGFPRALARTLHELMLARVDAGRARGAAARRSRPRAACSSASRISSRRRRRPIAARCSRRPREAAGSLSRVAAAPARRADGFGGRVRLRARS